MNHIEKLYHITYCSVKLRNDVDKILFCLFMFNIKYFLLLRDKCEFLYKLY